MYEKLEARLHDVFWEAEAPGAELELIRQHLGESRGRCLEIGCGSGRILLPLAEAGYLVDGNDISRDMLDLLEHRKGGREVHLFHGKTLAQDVSGYQHFIVPAFTFMLFADGEVEQTLRYLAENAMPGATLYATIFMPWAEICGELEEGEWYRDHEAETAAGEVASCRTQFSIDRTYQKLRRRHQYSYRSADGVTEAYESEQSLRWYTHTEMVTILENSGWRVNNRIFDLDREADSENAHLYTFEAEKIG